MITILMAGATSLLFHRYLKGKVRTVSTTVLVVWLMYVGVFGYVGVIARKFPPGPALFVVPVALFVVFFLLNNSGVKSFSQAVPLPLLIGLQTFRIFVELSLFGLYQLKLLPVLMTFAGGNLDILVGLSAPIVTWLLLKNKIGIKTIQIWNWLGIVLLLNIVSRALLTFAGVIHTDIPNLAIGIFPFTFLPGFLAPLALCLHVLTLRALSTTRRIS